MPHPVETYLHDLYSLHSSGAGVDELSSYPPLATLLNEIGKSLQPRLRCLINLTNQGAGLPDGGLFTSDQFPKASAPHPREGQLPSRGAIEVKPPKDDARRLASTKQVTDYLAFYRQVLVITHREFLLLGYDAEGRPAQLESYRLADSEADFWEMARHPQKAATEHGDRLVEYLKRALLRRAELVEPKALAWFLASYAREAKARVEARKDLPELAAIRSALEEALGMEFQGEKGERFFRSTLVQTLFYGIFSAWVLWDKQHKGDPAARFNWHEAGWYLHVPMISALFQQISSPAQLGPLDIAEVLDWAGDTLNRVHRGQFFSQFEEGHAVQYFYEPFLQAFDPELRKELGVWYTPPEIVSYMVERVDRVLRSELGLADGLADPSVYVLDPCCGTGAYLVEVLKRIQRTLQEKGGDALAAQDLKRAAMDRVFGFEILPAPFVIAHLQLGLLLQNLGAPFSDASGERAGVFLTNALTGWEPPEGEKKRLPFIELEQERDAAERVKQEVPILVVIGNPPYNGFAGVSPAEEQGLVEPYKQGLRDWGIAKNYLDDLYVRFFRLAERRIAERNTPGRGIVCFISNFSYLDDPSFVVMRKRLLDEFGYLWIDCMNGDSRETGKRTPDGRPDPSVFSTERNAQGIRVGTAITLMARAGDATANPLVLYRDFWGASKRQDLLTGLAATSFDGGYRVATPTRANRFSFRPEQVSGEYASWADMPSLAGPTCSLGILDNRAGALVSIDRAPLVARMAAYYDPSRDFDEVASVDGASGITRDAARFDARKTRQKVLANESFSESAARRGLVRPMDGRWCYHSQVRPLWNEPRPEYARQCWPGNGALATRKRGVASPEGVPFVYTTSLGFQHALMSDAYYFPVRLRRGRPNGGTQAALLGEELATTANLSPSARAYLVSLGLPDPDADAETAGLIWMHALAIGYSPAYLKENADGIRRDWPRTPLPNSRDALLASAELGQQIAALLDTEHPVPGVTAGRLRQELQPLAVISRVGGGALNPDAHDLALTAGWGHAGKARITMPGAGKSDRRPYTAQEAAALAAGAEELGLGPDEALARLGDSTRDIYLNNLAYWRNVPEKVWTYTIGGYQVMKKWLSYREHDLLGRSLTPEEAREVTHMARRLAALLLLEPALDENYHTVRAATYDWV